MTSLAHYETNLKSYVWRMTSVLAVPIMLKVNDLFNIPRW